MVDGVPKGAIKMKHLFNRIIYFLKHGKDGYCKHCFKQLSINGIPVIQRDWMPTGEMWITNSEGEITKVIKFGDKKTATRIITPARKIKFSRSTYPELEELTYKGIPIVKDDPEISEFMLNPNERRRGKFNNSRIK